MVSSRVTVRRERHDVGRVVDIAQRLIQHRKRIGGVAGGELVPYVDNDLAQLLLIGFRAFELLDEPGDFGLRIRMASLVMKRLLCDPRRKCVR
jgi:hypothetical protein